MPVTPRLMAVWAVSGGVFLSAVIYVMHKPAEQPITLQEPVQPALRQTAPPATVAQCSARSEQSAFEVQALRSAMMVLATGCHDAKRYNAFIGRFKPVLQENERAMAAYYRNRGGQAAHDRFVTDLANAMSQRAIEQGATFCAHDGALFTEAMAVSPADLSGFAAAKTLVPAGLATCTTETGPVRQRSRS